MHGWMHGDGGHPGHSSSHRAKGHGYGESGKEVAGIRMKELAEWMSAKSASR